MQTKQKLKSRNSLTTYDKFENKVINSLRILLCYLLASKLVNTYRRLLVRKLTKKTH